jgi:hypothetical protein
MLPKAKIPAMAAAATLLTGLSIIYIYLGVTLDGKK